MRLFFGRRRGGDVRRIKFNVEQTYALVTTPSAEAAATPP